MGLGSRAGGVGVARYLSAAGAIVTVTDMKPEPELREAIQQLAGYPIRFVLGGHDERDFTRPGADIVVRNPAVRRTNRFLRIARDSGVRIEMEMSLFLADSPAPAIGVTGTKGKTTTASLCAEMLRHWDSRTLLAGNMGISAVTELGRLDADTPVVLELSSWQLEALDEHKLGPRIAVLTNISEDHLDAYDGFSDYAATKRSIARHLTPVATLVVNADDPEAALTIGETRAHVIPFGEGDRGVDGSWVAGDQIVWRQSGRTECVDVPARLPYLGLHQRLNAAAAAAAAFARGASVNAVRDGLNSFAGVPNRMELVAEIEGVTYINDSAATAPAAATANLRGLTDRQVHLIAGGHDKQGDLAPLADAFAAQAMSLHLLAGSASPALATLLAKRGVGSTGPHGTMAEAVQSAAAAARPGDVVLLSPGCASFGLFRDEFDRGQQFREAVNAISSERAVRQ